MKIAVTYEDGKIFPHFGHTQAFKLYDAEDGKVISSRVVPTDGCGHGALAAFLREQGAEILICGGIGGGARMALDEAGIRLYGGASGDADAAVEALLRGALAYDPDAACTHHGHDEVHRCGGEGHTCGHGENHACGGGESHTCGHGEGHGCGSGEG